MGNNYHSHPHEQRTDSFRVDLRNTALHTAHSLIHIPNSLFASVHRGLQRQLARSASLNWILSLRLGLR